MYRCHILNKKVETFDIKFEVMRVYNRSLSNSSYTLTDDLMGIKYDNIAYVIKILLNDNNNSPTLSFVSVKDGLIYLPYKSSFNNKSEYLAYEVNPIFNKILKGEFDPELIDFFLKEIYKILPRYTVKNTSVDFIKYSVSTGFIRKDKIWNLSISKLLNTCHLHTQVVNVSDFYVSFKNDLFNTISLFKYNNSCNMATVNFKTNDRSNTIRFTLKSDKTLDNNCIKVIPKIDKNIIEVECKNTEVLNQDDMLYLYNKCV